MLSALISKQQIEELGSSLGSSVIGSAIEELNKSPILSENSISKLVQNILFGAESSIDEFADTSPFAGLGNRTANMLSPEFNALYNTFLDKVNLPEKTSQLVQEVKKGLTKELDEFTATTTLKIEESLNKVRESAYKETDMLQEHVQKLSSKTFREVTLTALPWIALTGAVIVGVPLAILYIYHRAKKNLDREEVSTVPTKKKPINPIQNRMSPYYHTL
ncbi:MAG: hypothetical protein K2Y01_08840 [Rhabdochlamydiaceae bacterium]|nr:hypothetical protein [Rhabdochlamydiaceae bacterium]